MLWRKIAFNSYFFIALILCGLMTVGILAMKNFLPPLVPLFYGKPVGTDQLVSFWHLFIVPATTLVVIAINILINTSINDIFIKRVLAAAALVVSIMATVTIVKIVILVGFI